MRRERAGPQTALPLFFVLNCSTALKASPMVMTAFEEEYSAGIAISVGAREVIKKPSSLEEFAIRLHKMINDAEALRRLKSQKGADEEMEDLMKELEETLKKR